MLEFSINSVVKTKYKLTRHIDLKDVKYRDSESKLNTLGKQEIAKRTIQIELDFNDVKPPEIEYYLSEQTTPLKQWYNNNGQYLKDNEILEQVKKGVLIVSVRSLLDDRTSRGLTDEEKDLRTMKKQLAGGKSIEDIRKEKLAVIERLENELKQAVK